MSEGKKKTKHSSLTLRLGGTLVFVLAFSVGLSSLLTYFNFEKRHRELISSRLEVMLDEVRIGIEQGTNLGLPLSSLMDTSSQLQTLLATDSYIHQASVVTRDGKRLFSAGAIEPLPATILSDISMNSAIAFVTGQASPTSEKATKKSISLIDLIPLHWFKQKANRTDTLFIENKQYLLVAEPLFNTFDIQTGLVVLAYQRDGYRLKNMAVLIQQAKQSGLWILISVITGLILLWLVLHRLRVLIAGMDQSLEKSLVGSDEQYVIKNQQDALEKEFNQLHQSVQEARRRNPSG